MGAGRSRFGSWCVHYPRVHVCSTQASELGAVLRGLGGAEPRPQEVALLMEKMDKDKNGVIR